MYIYDNVVPRNAHNTFMTFHVNINLEVNIKAVQESPYSQINDLEELYAKPNMETMQSGQTSGIHILLHTQTLSL